LRIIAALRKFETNFFKAAMTNGKSGAFGMGSKVRGEPKKGVEELHHGKEKCFLD
jgi:hypothetical protein